jgi:aspartyl-tRNA(Asn)/glutamyl-tRNA(Gln) amidotransferase subunit A
MLENYVPLENATVVQRLVDAGMIIIGKNNCDAWAHGGSTENSDFGPTKNPHDTSRVPGGSSGGSAAAVAAHEAPLSIGTDTGGSIRQPASYCGVVGLKPTYGLCSRYGLIAMASSLDVPGPITTNVYDNALALSIMVGDPEQGRRAGADPKDAASAGSQSHDYLINIDQGVRGLKIGLPKEYFAEGISSVVKSAVLSAVEKYKKLGAEIVEISLPITKYGIATYYVIQPAEVSSNLGRYDGIKYGYAASKSKNLIDHYYQSRTEGLGDEAKRRIMLGTYVLSAGYFDAYYKKAMQVRTLIKKDFVEAFKKCDVILGPTAPTTAFKFGAHKSDPLAMYLEDAYTVNANLAGIPALALPCGKDREGLPIGMQLMGPHFSESLLFKVGRAYEKN